MKVMAGETGFTILPENRDESDAIERWSELTQHQSYEPYDVVRFESGRIQRAHTMSFTFGPDEIEHE